MPAPNTHRAPGPLGGDRPRRLVRRHDRAAGDPGAVRRRDRNAGLGADLVQPGARARRSPLRSSPVAARHRPLRREPVFAAASSTCAFAPSFGVLVAARTSRESRAPPSSAPRWGCSPLRWERTPRRRGSGPSPELGAACGPAVGGFLTQLFGWESIFVVQAPLLLLTLAALYGCASRPRFDRWSGRTSGQTPR